MERQTEAAVKTRGPGRWLAGLYRYFAAVQAVHLIALIVQGVLYAGTGTTSLLAPPPVGDWSAGELRALLMTGAVDGLVSLMVLASLRGALRGEPRAVHRMTSGLTAAHYSALVFGAITFPAGVWSDFIVYWIMGLLFLPFPLAFWIQLRQQS